MTWALLGLGGLGIHVDTIRRSQDPTPLGDSMLAIGWHRSGMWGVGYPNAKRDPYSAPDTAVRFGYVQSTLVHVLLTPS